MTAWALLGSFDWGSLLTKPSGTYEVGLFDVRANLPRPTALIKMVNAFAHSKEFSHPILQAEGWWNRPSRIQYFLKRSYKTPENKPTHTQPLLIIGKNGAPGNEFINICNGRSIHHYLYSTAELNSCDPLQLENTIKELDPWAIIDISGFVNVDEAKNDEGECYFLNSVALQSIGAFCNTKGVKLVTFSSDSVYDRNTNEPYVGNNFASHFSIYGHGKAKAEKHVLSINPDALIIRTDANDILNSPAYVPTLINTTLDFMFDGECGIWDINQNGEISWASINSKGAQRSNQSLKLIPAIPLPEMELTATSSNYSMLNTGKRYEMPTLEYIEKFFYGT